MPLCHSIYDYDACSLAGDGRTNEVKRCQHVAYPNHPHSYFRKQCKQPLMKICKSKSTTFLRPFKIYCHQNIIKSLRMLLGRPNFLQNCEQWRQREINTELLGDIYDGKVWKEVSGLYRQTFF